MKPTLTVDTVTKKVIVTTAAAQYVYGCRSEAYVDFPELRPAVLTPAQDRAVSRAQRTGRAAVNGYGHSRSGKR